MKLKKHIECGNDWSVEFSKPHKLTLQASIFKKTNNPKKLLLLNILKHVVGSKTFKLFT